MVIDPNIMMQEDLSFEEKLLRRKMNNRISAQIARDRKKAYIKELEMKVMSMEQEKLVLMEQNMKLFKILSTLNQRKSSNIKTNEMDNNQLPALEIEVQTSHEDNCDLQGNCLKNADQNDRDSFEKPAEFFRPQPRASQSLNHANEHLRNEKIGGTTISLRHNRWGIPLLSQMPVLMIFMIIALIQTNVFAQNELNIHQTTIPNHHYQHQLNKNGYAHPATHCQTILFPKNAIDLLDMNPKMNIKQCETLLQKNHVIQRMAIRSSHWFTKNIITTISSIIH